MIKLRGNFQELDFALSFLANWFGENTAIASVDKNELAYVAVKFAGAEMSEG